MVSRPYLGIWGAWHSTGWVVHIAAGGSGARPRSLGTASPRFLANKKLMGLLNTNGGAVSVTIARRRRTLSRRRGRRGQEQASRRDARRQTPWFAGLRWGPSKWDWFAARNVAGIVVSVGEHSGHVGLPTGCGISMSPISAIQVLK